MKKYTISQFLLATTVLQLAQPYLVQAEEPSATSPTVAATSTTSSEDGRLALAGSAASSTGQGDEMEAITDGDTTSGSSEESATVSSSGEGSGKETLSTKETVEAPAALSTLDDSKLQAWITKHQFQFVQTLFRTDGENKEIHASVDGYQAPYDLKDYTYLSSIITTTDKGPSLVHIYRDASYVDQAIVRTEYYDGTSGKKLQKDQKGQAFEESIGERKYYYDVIVEENGEKVYKIFYLTDEDFVAYGGSKYYVRLTDYTRFVDQSTGQEIATQQEGFIPIYDVSGYHFVSAEIIEENGLSYFVQTFASDESSEEIANTEATNEIGQVVEKDTDDSPSQAKASKMGLPSTGENRSLATVFGLGLLAVLALVGIRWFKAKSKND
ncbi:LPXTG cell wall anchor domain-containing protein [Streptococcus moroccensis]|uniref:LPXTG-motif cell wall-anchored protein n=1 Tax=Streptococcus moroccensis TaxID=1451356 RepID=A0ABT9YS71_9STRE|nr:LPXTG cell wall anchor domain-containing protein [Streptococcus moroccensis]MDQ0222838.1 LPXTG-motif cell wall-anchored protein [Streptococcus moroccensis]